MEGVAGFCGRRVGESELALIREVTARFRALSRGAGPYGVRASAMGAPQRSTESARVPRVPGAAGARWADRVAASAATPPARVGHIDSDHFRRRSPPGNHGGDQRSRGASVDRGRSTERSAAVARVDGALPLSRLPCPYGAQLRFFVWADRPRPQVVAGLQFRARRGAWRCAIAGSGGAIRCGRRTSSAWSKTAAS